MSQKYTKIVLALILLTMVGCGSTTKSGTSDESDASNNGSGDMAQDQGKGLDLPDLCTEGTAFSNGVSIFEDATSETQIPQINPEGVRMSGVDFDGDGYLDLYLRRTGLVGDDFSADGRRTSWLLRNRGDGTFEDVTEQSGLVKSRYDASATRSGDATVWGDIDNDGDMDAFVGFSNDGSVFDAPEIMINDGSGKFSFYQKPMDFHVRQAKISIGGAAFVDVNRDGRLDLWLGQGAVDGVPQQDRLYIQDADGAFRDSTTASGLGTQEWTASALNAGLAHTNSWSAAACDLNDDGIPDLLSASYGRAPNHLWMSGGPQWSNASVTSGYAFDGDQDWTGNHSARCFCEGNPNATGCADAPAPTYSCASVRGWTHASDTQPYRLGGNSGTTVCADFNGDGHLDLLTSEIVHFDVGSNSDATEILYNDGAGKFTRPGNAVTGLTREPEVDAWNNGDITVAALDFDNDAAMDVFISSTDYPGTRGLLYRQKPDGTFQQLSSREGIDHTSSHGMVVADFDRDGDLDMIVGHSPNRCSSGDHCYPVGERHVRYFKNRFAQDGNWIQIELVGDAESTNMAAIGARVDVTSGDRLQTQEVGGGHGHYGLQNDAVLHFGLGAACSGAVKIRWPDVEGSEAEYELQSGYRYRIHQSGALEAVLN